MKSPVHRIFCVLALLAAVSFSCFAQTETAGPTPDDKAEQIVQKAIQAVGGPAYLGVQTSTVERDRIVSQPSCLNS